jgi:hypothetical protein
MHRALLHAWSPWLVALVALVVVAYLLVRINRARPDWRRLAALHREETGGVQSLAFVLTLPLFMMVMLFIVQVSQLMIAIGVVHYAAYAAARAATVWTPAAVAPFEPENCLSSYVVDTQANNQFPVLDPNDPNYGPSEGGVTYFVAPGSPKYNKILAAAVMACMPISPSRDLPAATTADSQGTTLSPAIIKAVYASMATSSQSNSRVPARLDNKLAYAAANTALEVRFYHSNQEPPLVTYLLPDDPAQFRAHEMGWQDQITVKVHYNLALLPGVGRVLAGHVFGRQDGIEGTPGPGGVYQYPLEAAISMGNEGERSVVRYGYGAL